MSNLQLDWTATEILAAPIVDEPLIVRGVVCHGGYDADGVYRSPRTRFRRAAIDAWQQHHRETTGTEVLDAPVDSFPGHYPNLDQARFLLANKVREPIVGLLTRIGTVEGFGGAIRDLAPTGDVQRHFVEDVRGTAIAHLAEGLLEAHARDESGWRDEAGHDRMWYAVRDIAFEDPLDEQSDREMRACIEAAAASVPMPTAFGTREFDGVDPAFETLIAFMTRVLFIEIRAYHAFAWAEALLSDTDLVAGDGDAARLVSYIRQDESPHVDYLRTSLSEMRARTFVGTTRNHIGSDVIGTVWDTTLAESRSLGDLRNKAVYNALLDSALVDRKDGQEIRDEHDRLATETAA
ncbi:MAG TPA: hypothetical protein VH274_01470 [Mycobacteriales bacterium]|nr:hypothetical protein [Mycobacteriales bacterium]